MEHAIIRKQLFRIHFRSSRSVPFLTASRRRQKGSDYTSTSKEEYEASAGTPKHKRSHASASASMQTSRGQKTEVTRSKSVSLEPEEDELQNEADHYQNWSTHSAEIAKYLHY